MAARTNSPAPSKFPRGIVMRKMLVVKLFNYIVYFGEIKKHLINNGVFDGRVQRDTWQTLIKALVTI